MPERECRPSAHRAERGTGGVRGVAREALRRGGSAFHRVAHAGSPRTFVRAPPFSVSDQDHRHGLGVAGAGFGNGRSGEEAERVVDRPGVSHLASGFPSPDLERGQHDRAASPAGTGLAHDPAPNPLAESRSRSSNHQLEATVPLTLLARANPVWMQGIAGRRNCRRIAHAMRPTLRNGAAVRKPVHPFGRGMPAKRAMRIG